MSEEAVGALCKEIPCSEKAGSHSVWISTLGSGKEKEVVGSSSQNELHYIWWVNVKLMPLSKWENHFIWKQYIQHRHQYSALTSVSLCSLYSVENILWCSTNSLFWASLAALYATAIQWMFWIKPTMALLEEGCNFLVICMLRWWTGYEGTRRDPISLYVMHSLFKRKKLRAGFPWSKSSTRAELHLSFHGVAENKCMFTVTVNLQTGEGKWLLQPRKSLWNEALN